MKEQNLFHYLKNIPVKAALLLFLFLTSLYMFGDIVKDVLWENEGYIDAVAFDFLDDYINPHLTKVMVVVSLFGSAYFLLPAYIILVTWLLIKKKKPIAMNAAIIGITSPVLVFILKNLFQRTRPTNPLNDPAFNYSFPSGHTTTAFIFFGLLIYLILNNMLSIRYKYIVSFFLFMLSIVIGLSRIYLRKHFASDVLAGFCVGYSWLLIAVWLLKRTRKSKT